MIESFIYFVLFVICLFGAITGIGKLFKPKAISTESIEDFKAALIAERDSIEYKELIEQGYDEHSVNVFQVTRDIKDLVKNSLSHEEIKLTRDKDGVVKSKSIKRSRPRAKKGSIPV